MSIVSFGLIYLSAECIAIVRRVALDCIIASHESEIREFSIEKLLKMPVSYYSGCLSGEKTAQLNQGVAGFSQLIKIMCNDVFATVLTAICTLVQVFLNAPLVMVGIMLLYLMLSLTISVFQIRSQNGIRESIVGQKNALDGQICQSISNLELIRGIHAEGYEKRRLLPSILNISRTEKRHHRYMGSFDSLKQLCKIVFQVVILCASILLISNGKMSAGSVITVCLLFQQLIKPIDEVYRFMDETASSVIKARALLEVAARPSDAVFDICASGEKTDDSDIRVEDVVVTNPEKSISLAWYENIVIPDIGNVIAVTNRKIAKAAEVKGGGILVDGLGVGDVGNVVLKDRLELSEEGILLIVLGLDRTTGVISSGPEIISRGFIYTGNENSYELMEELRSVVRSSLKKVEFKDYSLNQVKVSIVKAVRGYLGRKIKRRPMILPIIYED